MQDAQFSAFADGDAVYRFFELFDLANVPNAKAIFELAAAKRIRLTPPPKPIFEEKMLFALLWNRNLHGFWRQELGESFFNRLLRLVPYTWIVDPAPLPPHAAIPELNLTDWRQLKALSQKERELILKVSGFSAHAWGARGVYLGSDLSHADWAAAVDEAIANFAHSPRVLQRYHKPGLVEAQWFDFERNQLVPMKGRVRLCPYYFVAGDGGCGARRAGRRAGHDLPGRQEDHPRHDGRHLRALLVMSLSEYIFLAASSLFVIVDPLAAVPAFLAMTPTDTPEQRIQNGAPGLLRGGGRAAGLRHRGQVDIQVPRHHHARLPARRQHRAAAGGAGHVAGAALARAGNLGGDGGGRRKDGHRRDAAGDPDAGRARGHLDRHRAS